MIAIARRLLLLTVTVAALACGPTGSKGTMPPAGPNGDIDPKTAPDFIAVTWGDRDAIGYVPRRFLFPEPTTSADVPRDEAWPVFAADLHTLIGHMVQGKGFVPLGVDPATVTDRPVQQGPSAAAPSSASGSVAVYVRNTEANRVWLVQVNGDGRMVGPSYGFENGVGVACLSVELEHRLILLDHPPEDSGIVSGREINPGHEPYGGAAVWIDVTRQGRLIEGRGIPLWWPDAPQAC